MKKKLLSFCLACLALASVNAQKEYYIPKALIMPLHNAPQQLFASAGYGGGYDVNLSYSLSRHIALFATGTINDGKGKRTSFIFGDRYDIVKHDRALTYGAGYFKNPKGKLNVLETYAGFGTYHVNNYWFFTGEPDLGNNYTAAKYSNVFWQLNLGRQTPKYDYGFAARLSYNSYKDVSFYNSSPNESDQKSSYKNFSGLNIDPAISFGYHLDMLSINLQAGLSVPLTSSKRTTVNTFTTFFNDVTTVTVLEDKNTKITDPLIAAFARLSLQYNLNLGKPRHAGKQE